MKTTPSILHLEEFSLNAWPALQTVLYDGWVLRFAGGYTRRANSVNPLYASSLPLDEKLAVCEQFYRSRELPVIFKLTSASQPAELDSALAQRGYQADAHTSMQLLDLQSAVIPAETPGFTCSGALSETWFPAFCALSGVSEQYIAPMRKILELITPSHAFGMIEADGKPIACGLLVQQGEFVGLYDIVVAQEARGKGYGRGIMQGLLAHGRQRGGAKTAYLQVMLNNPPALGLYAGLGFREAYRYWYRVK